MSTSPNTNTVQPQLQPQQPQQPQQQLPQQQQPQPQQPQPQQQQQQLPQQQQQPQQQLPQQQQQPQFIYVHPNSPPPAYSPNGQVSPIVYAPNGQVPQYQVYQGIPLNQGDTQQLLPPNVVVVPSTQLNNIQGKPDLIPRTSAVMRCPFCNKDVNTIVGYEDNAIVWILCVILCFFSLCCIPFFVDDIKDAVHYYPKCRNEIARKERKI